ncbi:MAG TPA: XdhC/CoxI family protein [Syntrophorhabdaceae bacterium]|nr:XdhC/CoxI family protein [Syntrophorhabdaceae bacterium]
MHLFETLAKHLEENRCGALATIVSRVGATPRDAGAKLFIADDGSIFGSVGGGCVESEVWHAAKSVMDDRTSRMLRYALNGKTVEDEGMICGGTLEFFIEPVLAKHREVYGMIAECRKTGKKALIVSSMEGSVFTKSLMTADGRQAGDPLPCRFSTDEAERYFRSGPSITVKDGFVTEIFAPPRRLFIYGAGHISQHISRFAKAVGFEITLIDDRDLFANAGRFPDADAIVVKDFNELSALYTPASHDYAVIVTRGHKHDATVLEEVLKNPPRYVGMIGSGRKIKIVYDELQKKGYPEELLKTVHAPIGLDIGAETPEEIAIAIVAELIKVRSGEI